MKLKFARGVKSDNDGLTVVLNFWSMEPYKDDFDADRARVWIKGQATRVHRKGRQERFFNDAGQLLTILGEWNRKQLKELKSGDKQMRKAA